MDWTDEQKLAINQEGTNIIVSAGAGSGKTAVLSERVLRKVMEGIDIRNILILTFTNEAAGEMKYRIRKKIKEAGLREPLLYIDSAYITTFDAYALSFVKKYHTLLNISDNISIIDSSIIGIEKMRILDQIFLEYYNAKNPLFLKLIDDFTTRDDDKMKEDILKINSTLDLKYDKQEYLEKYINSFFSDQHIDSLIYEYFMYLKNLCDDLENDVYLLSDYLDEKNYSKIYDAYQVFFSPKCYDDLYKINTTNPRFNNVSEDGKSIRDRIKQTRDEIEGLTKYSEKELKEQLLLTKDYVQIIIEIILELNKRLDAYKRKHEAFEFVDIAKMAIKIVKENEDVRNELKNTFNEILIDEYQDTNDLQEIFISEIQNNNVYMVGDIKQSIYRFRNANPNIFKAKYEDYAKHLNGEKIDLLKNFRSRKEVLANINEIFNILMSSNYGGVDYQNNHEMVYGNMAYINKGKTNYDYNLEVWEYDNDDDSSFSNVEIEIFTIIRDIQKKVQNKYQVYDFELKGKRDIKYQDFCIILDRGTDMPLYKKIFEHFNIPMEVYKDSNLVMADDLAIIKNIISLILGIHEKNYDKKMRYNFVSIARSFIGNLSDQEILTYINDNTFYDSDIYKIAQKLAHNIDNKTVGILLNEIIEDFGFYEKLIKVGDVDAGIFRIHYLFDLAKNAEELGFTINDFLVYLEDMIKNEKEIRYKDKRGVGDCVRIMNIHKSKGLEFPICYFAGFQKKFNLSDLKTRFLFDNKYGILVPYFKEGIGTTILKTLIKNQFYHDEISEKIRLFYVALTRAKEQMIMIVPKIPNSLKQNGVVDFKVASKYRSFYDFISSMKGNLNEYFKLVNLNDLNLTKDYEILKNNNYQFDSVKTKIDFKELDIPFRKIEDRHASKIIQNVLTKKEAQTLEFGTMMHEKLEKTDFKCDSDNKYVNELKKTFDFNNAIIYQELEFYFSKDDTLFHGIIDLMLEYDEEIKIIDYKLKNIDDDAYVKQLKVYYDYVSSVSSKPIKLYLYSILDNKVKELEGVNL